MSKIHQEVTARMIAELKQGTAPWVKPWSVPGAAPSGLPTNVTSSNAYSGVNILLLWLAQVSGGFASDYFLTFRQAKAAGGHVRKGEKGARIIYVGQASKERADGTDDHFNFLKQYTVFSVEQCEDLPAGYLPKPAREISEAERIQRAEAVLRTIPAQIERTGAQAFFAPGPDLVRIPKPGHFATIGDYYATLFHELIHWTGHKSRLDRDAAKRYGDNAYAFEELIAELGAAFLCAELGIPGQLRHADYLAHWVRLMEDHEAAIVSAAAQASKAAKHLMGFGGLNSVLPVAA